ncbi:hypothetical protein H097_12608 [Pseudomonas sp. FH4]|jgi:hypothetical protein|uniref:Uncharacterized protein n=1 Tax=Pseudomonas brenneri TaxID=129817 RepID=A0A5B2UUF5_9PSED|nr:MULTISPECIES: hypothetical protein [Pseudomonas fluorescens group]MBU0937337.1 hypothetical protein [Gammaproteobacteria bacterium]ETK18654.1 hypothetical protein H097_12608 [Pseudomonas sp. FH4]KAA2229589.1 hypothetical protein F1720_14290 [Pseudomonas brenneri]MBF8006490.1 hypothetical protein [Pseudomonas brenneri]TWR81012.1 hypothetical protein FJD34_03905 [Pseudomonas brenneri]
MATKKKCTFTSKSNKSKPGTQNIDAADLPNIGDTVQLDGDPPALILAKNFHIDNGEVTQIDFTLA